MSARCLRAITVPLSSRLTSTQVESGLCNSVRCVVLDSTRSFNIHESTSLLRLHLHGAFGVDHVDVQVRAQAEGLAFVLLYGDH